MSSNGTTSILATHSTHQFHLVKMSKILRHLHAKGLTRNRRSRGISDIAIPEDCSSDDVTKEELGENAFCSFENCIRSVNVGVASKKNIFTKRSSQEKEKEEKEALKQAFFNQYERP